MKYMFSDLLHTACQAVTHERHMISNLEPNNKSKTQISAFDCSNVITRKQTNKQWTRLLLMERKLLAIVKPQQMKMIIAY